MNTQKQNWWKYSIAYQIYPQSFKDSNADGLGDLEGIIEGLPWLQRLGVDLVWLSPVFTSPWADNGYDISDYQGIAPRFGTMETMKKLLGRAKELGIRVVLDLVVNHSSNQHPWFLESRTSSQNPKRDWYIWKKGRPGPRGEELPPTDWPSIFGGSCWSKDDISGEWYFHTFAAEQPDLNWENSDLRRAVYDMMNYWIDLGIAGFRVDAITFIKKNQDWPISLEGIPKISSVLDGGCCNQPGILDFLAEMKEQVLEPRNIVTVAEAPGIPPRELDPWIGPERGVFSMIFTFDHVDIDTRFDKPWEYQTWTLPEWKDCFFRWQKALNDGPWLGLYLENHDQVRSVSKFGDTGIYREASAKTLAVWYFLMGGTPFIYQGQEIGMANCHFDGINEYRDLASLNAWRDGLATGKTEKEMLSWLEKRSRDHSRTPFPWDDSLHGGFSSVEPWIKSNPEYPRINAKKAAAEANGIFATYQELIRLRRANRIFVEGTFTALWAESPILGAYRRIQGTKTVTVICNFSAETAVLPEPFEPSKGRVLLDTQGGSGETFNGKELSPWQSLVIEEGHR